RTKATRTLQFRGRTQTIPFEYPTNLSRQFATATPGIYCGVATRLLLGLFEQEIFGIRLHARRGRAPIRACSTTTSLTPGTRARWAVESARVTLALPAILSLR